MIIVHADDLALSHIIYEYPDRYHELLNAGGHSWVKIKGSIGIDQINLSRHEETNEIQLHHTETLEEVQIIARSAPKET